MNRVCRNLTQVFIALMAVTNVLPCEGNDEPKPIVDIRVDDAHKEIVSSAGDEWAPTWGRDDVLYTGSDDGSSFGKIPFSPIAFGKLQGDDPYHLTGTTLNRMFEYREPDEPGPEGSLWRRVESYRSSGVLYRIVPCNVAPSSSAEFCLASSKDQGKTWSSYRSIFGKGEFDEPGFIRYSEAVFRGAMDIDGHSYSRDYVYVASYSGQVDGQDAYLIGRVLHSKLGHGDRADWSFLKADGEWGADIGKAAPVKNALDVGPDGANWKVTNSYSVDGTLYMFITRCHYPWNSTDPGHRHVFRDSSIIKSVDQGHTWRRSSEENYAMPMFPGTRFGTAYFVWYGKDGAAVVDNADKYVYAVSNNGHFEGGDDYVLGRVLREKLPNLSSSDWSFYKNGDGMKGDGWTSELNEAKPILSNPGQSGMTGMTYIGALHRYVMVVWHYTQYSFQTAWRKKDLSTTLEFFESPKPWGPWSKVKSLKTESLGWYTPIIGQRFQATVGPTTVTAFLYATGAPYKLSYMPVVLSTQ